MKMPKKIMMILFAIIGMIPQETDQALPKLDRHTFGPQPSFKGIFDPARFGENKLLFKEKKDSRSSDEGVYPRKTSIKHLGNQETAKIKTKAVLNSPDFALTSPSNVAVPRPMKMLPPVWLMSAKGLKIESCRASSFNRTVQISGCKPKTVRLNFCIGRCQSFFIPSDEASLRYCSQCLPGKWKMVVVILECPSHPRGYKVKLMRSIESCKCTSVKSCT